MAFTVGIVTISDKGSKGERVDLAGPALKEMLKDDKDYNVIYTGMVSDDKEEIKKELLKLTDEKGINLILTTGGTGFSKRDNTPEVTKEIMEKDAPGISEYMRMKSAEITNKAMLSRGASVIRKDSIIVNLPGSPKGATENLAFIKEPIKHGLNILLGKDSECATPINI